jgi:cytochrome b6-f complex iron-sulfur subunit
MDKDLITRSGSLTESRRRFLEKSGASLVLATFGAAFFTSCSSTDDADPTQVVTPTPPGNSSNGITITGSTITINLAMQTALNTSGNWLLIENAKTLVANVNGSFIALTSVCTHSGCDRNWTFASNRFTCTCHGSIFDPGGNVVQGPATQPLTSFSTQVTGTTLTVNK